jgi:hypothetical protein
MPDRHHINAENFLRRYWLKHELQAFARSHGIDASGGKTEIADRIKRYLKEGKVTGSVKSGAKKSSFDWNREPLNPHTRITDNYRNTRNVRNFFIEQLGPGFSFNVEFLAWLKQHVGHTLGKAVRQWKLIRHSAATKKGKKEPAPQFEYNRYIRAYFADNADGTLREAIRCWKYKKMKSGAPVYERKDLRASAAEKNKED